MDLPLLDIALSWADIIVGAGVFAFMFLAHRKGTLSEARLKKTALVLTLFLAVVTGVKIATHYFILKADASFGAFLLPPHQPLDWFAIMALKRYAFPFAAALVAGIAMYFAAIRVNKTFRGDLFVEQDRYIFLLAALIVGWPNFVLYLATAIILTVFLSGAATLRHGADTRIVLTDALLYAIPVVLLFGNTVAPYIELWRLTIFS